MQINNRLYRIRCVAQIRHVLPYSKQATNNALIAELM